MYAQRMRLPEGKQCAAFITVNLSAEYFWISLNEKAKEMPKTLVYWAVWHGHTDCRAY